MGPLDPETMMMQPPLRKLSDRSNATHQSERSSRSSRCTDEAQEDDSLQPPKRRSYHVAVVPVMHPQHHQHHHQQQPWTCKSCSYQNVDANTCAVCGGGGPHAEQYQKPAHPYQKPAYHPPAAPVHKGIAQCNSFASSYASGIDSIDTPKETPVKASSSEPTRNLDSFLKSKSDGSGRRNSSDDDSQASAATIKVSNRTEDQFWRSRAEKPDPIEEEQDGTSRSSDGSSSKRLKARNEGSNGGFQPPTPRSNAPQAMSLKGRNSPRLDDEGGTDQPKQSESSSTGYQPPQSLCAIQRDGGNPELKSRSEGSNGGFQPPTPRRNSPQAVSSRGRNSPRLHDEGGTDQPKQSESSSGYEPPQSLSARRDSGNPELKSLSEGSTGGFQQPQLLTTRHGSVGEEPQMLTTRHDSVAQDPSPTLSSPSLLHSKHRTDMSEITFSPSMSEGSYSQNSRSMPYNQRLDLLTTSPSVASGSASALTSLSRGGSRSIPSGDPDNFRSSSDISTFADEDSTLSNDKFYLSRRAFLKLISVVCVLAIAVTAVVAIALIERPQSTSPIASEEPDPGRSPLDLQPTGPPSLRPTRPPTDAPTVRPTPSPVAVQDAFAKLGQSITGHNAQDEVGQFVELAALGTVMAVSSGSGTVRLYKLNRSEWDPVGLDVTHAAASGAPLIALSSGDGNVLAVFVDGTVYTYVVGEDGEWGERGDPIDTGTRGPEGSSIALSSDGSTLAVATPDDGTRRGGQVCVYSYGPSPMGTQSIWNKLGSPLSGYSDQSGFDIDISDDGTRIVVASWIRLQNPNTQQTAVTSRHVRAHELEGRHTWKPYGQQVELVDTPDIRSTASLSISADGKTMAACTTAECNVYAYTLTENSWSRVGNKLSGGDAVSLSENGDIVVIGMPSAGVGGAVQAYEYSKRFFSSLGGSITGVGPGDSTGQAVSISGKFFAVGSPMNDSSATNAGSVQVYGLN